MAFTAGQLVQHTDLNDFSVTSVTTSGAVTAGSVTSTATATRVTNTLQTVANDAAVFIGAAASFGGLLVVVNVSDGAVGLFALNGGNNNTSEISDPSILFSNTLGTASMVNVGYDAAGASGAGYYVQNKRGASRNLQIVYLGQ